MEDRLSRIRPTQRVHDVSTMPRNEGISRELDASSAASRDIDGDTASLVRSTERDRANNLLRADSMRLRSASPGQAIRRVLGAVAVSSSEVTGGSLSAKLGRRRQRRSG